jgi:hypothetical protein
MFMKYKLLYPTTLALSFFVLASCKKSNPTSAEDKKVSTTTVSPTIPTDNVSAAAVKSSEIEKSIVAPTIDPVVRAAKLGFAQKLSNETEFFMLSQNGEELTKRFKNSKLWSFIISQNPMLAQDEEADPETARNISAMDYIGREFFVAMGKNSIPQLQNLFNAFSRLNYFQTRDTLNNLMNLIDNAKGMKETPMFGKFLEDFAKDEESGVSFFEKANISPILIGFKSTAEKKDLIKQQIDSLLVLVGEKEPFKPLEFQLNQNKFNGYQVSGKDLATQISSNKSLIEQLTSSLGKEGASRLISALEKKNLVIATGIVDDYVLLFLGEKIEDLKLASNINESIAASKDLQFTDTYLDKTLISVVYAQQGILKSLADSGGIAQYAKGIRDGLSLNTNKKRDTRDIEKLLDIVIEKEKDLQSLVSYDTIGLVAMLDEGLKIETFGGYDAGSVVSEPDNKLGSLAEGENIAFFANWTKNSAYSAKATSYLEAIVQTGYAAAQKIAEEEKMDNEKLKSFQQKFTLFDEKFRVDFIDLWSTLNGDFTTGLGDETAVVIDLAGEIPPIPKLPQELVKAGKFPRFSIVKPVTDRAKLAASWDKMNHSGESIMKKLSELMNTEQAMPQPMSSEKNDLISWFFAGPLFTNDFAPSVTLNDKWFVASSSKNHAIQLAAKAASSNTGKAGAWITLDFNALRSYGSKWLEEVDKNKETIFKDNKSALGDFNTNKEMIKKAIESAADLDQLTIHSRNELGKNRNSVHFKIK